MHDQDPRHPTRRTCISEAPAIFFRGRKCSFVSHLWSAENSAMQNVAVVVRQPQYYFPPHTTLRHCRVLAPEKYLPLATQPQVQYNGQGSFISHKCRCAGGWWSGVRGRENALGRLCWGRKTQPSGCGFKKASLAQRQMLLIALD
jgi:hypothetical protein